MNDAEFEELITKALGIVNKEDVASLDPDNEAPVGKAAFIQIMNMPSYDGDFARDGEVLFCTPITPRDEGDCTESVVGACFPDIAEMPGSVLYLYGHHSAGPYNDDNYAAYFSGKALLVTKEENTPEILEAVQQYHDKEVTREVGRDLSEIFDRINSIMTASGKKALQNTLPHLAAINRLVSEAF